MDTSTPSWLTQALRQQELMDQMMERVGVDVLTTVRADNGQAFFDARAKCRDCRHESDCRNWLELSETLRVPPYFCPNANFFRACTLEEHPLRDDPPRPAGVAGGKPVGKAKPLNVSFEQRASNELGKLVWKLRWLGEEEEVNKAQMQRARILARLELYGMPYAHIAMLNDTD
jgi:hypothetical protein